MYEDPQDYRGLQAVQADWQAIRDEAIAMLFAFQEMRDARSSDGAWKVLPLLPEAEDRDVFPATTFEFARRLLPGLLWRITEVPNLRACSLSLVEPGGEIKAHRHANPYASASLCLAGGAGARIIVDGAGHDLADGDMVVFDYRRWHRVVNQGGDARLALIIAVDLLDPTSRDGYPVSGR